MKPKIGAIKMKERTTAGDDGDTDHRIQFPALECLDLPYYLYSSHDGDGDSGDVSKAIADALRRSYEYERVEQWERAQVTLGSAEWSRTHLKLQSK